MFQWFLKCIYDSASLTFHSIHLPVANIFCYITVISPECVAYLNPFSFTYSLYWRSSIGPGIGLRFFPWPPYLDNVLDIRLWRTVWVYFCSPCFWIKRGYGFDSCMKYSNFFRFSYLFELVERLSHFTNRTFSSSSIPSVFCILESTYVTIRITSPSSVAR